MITSSKLIFIINGSRLLVFFSDSVMAEVILHGWFGTDMLHLVLHLKLFLTLSTSYMALVALLKQNKKEFEHWEVLHFVQKKPLFTIEDMFLPFTGTNTFNSNVYKKDNRISNYLLASNYFFLNYVTIKQNLNQKQL